MYDVQAVYSNMASHTAELQFFGALLMISGYLQVGEAIRLGFAHRSHAIPLFAVLYFFAHDVTYVLMYHHWFHDIDHPLFQTNYWFILAFIPLEIVLLYQIIRYSRAELFPGASLRQAILILIALQAATFVAFWWLRAQWHDPLFLVSFVSTQIVSHAFNIPLLLRRQSRKGQSMLFAWNILLGAGIVTFFFAFPLYGTPFQSIEFYLLGGVITLLGLAYIYLLRRAPAYSVARSSTIQTAAVA